MSAAVSTKSASLEAPVAVEVRFVLRMKALRKFPTWLILNIRRGGAVPLDAPQQRLQSQRSSRDAGDGALIVPVIFGPTAEAIALLREEKTHAKRSSDSHGDYLHIAEKSAGQRDTRLLCTGSANPMKANTSCQSYTN